jgi:hypothetical protein
MRSAETIGLRHEHCSIEQDLRRSVGQVGDDAPDGFANSAKLLCDQSGFSLTGDIDSLSTRR